LAKAVYDLDPGGVPSDCECRSLARYAQTDSARTRNSLTQMCLISALARFGQYRPLVFRPALGVPERPATPAAKLRSSRAKAVSEHTHLAGHGSARRKGPAYPADGAPTPPLARTSCSFRKCAPAMINDALAEAPIPGLDWVGGGGRAWSIRATAVAA
jgi:hypothetical protein